MPLRRYQFLSECHFFRHNGKRMGNPLISKTYHQNNKHEEWKATCERFDTDEVFDSFNSGSTLKFSPTPYPQNQRFTLRTTHLFWSTFQCWYILCTLSIQFWWTDMEIGWKVCLPSGEEISCLWRCLPVRLSGYSYNLTEKLVFSPEHFFQIYHKNGVLSETKETENETSHRKKKCKIIYTFLFKGKFKK